MGNDGCGQNLPVLISLVHTAEPYGHSTETYLADILTRIRDHPVSCLAELLPTNWQSRPNCRSHRHWTWLSSTVDLTD